MEPTESTRRRLAVRGQVQGVGFRPFVYRLARRYALAGFVANDARGARIEIEGPPGQLDAFERDLLAELPPLATIARVQRAALPPLGDTEFRITASHVAKSRRPDVTPDVATCPDCLRELLDPADRRFRYPFINCTNCGPRYSIILDVPYDRPRTTMAAFTMCPQCQAEYDDPANRRFHAQPNACPVCGPQLELRMSSSSGDSPERGDTALRVAAARLFDGAIVAVKGIGGYHLACRADRADTVRRLRARKLRDGKPLAIMVPNLDAAERIAGLDAADRTALQSTAAPIVLAAKRARHGIADEVAPACADFGLMLPYAPVHHLLFAEGLGPLVMTSANLAGQPLTYRDEDALEQLADVADAFLLHNREICRPIDDSVVFTFRNDIIPIRRARGFAPQVLRVSRPGMPAGRPRRRRRSSGAVSPRILAVGGELKSTVCLLRDGDAVIGEHLGDLTRPEAFRHFVDGVSRLQQLCRFEPDVVAYDLHPRYMATEFARRMPAPGTPVQHHHAHIACVMAEWDVEGPVIGLACDGTGYGEDRAVWGCEVLRCDGGTYERVGHHTYFPLVGGDAAAVETWRPAAALLREEGIADWPRIIRHSAAKLGLDVSRQDVDVFEQQARSHVNAPWTSSLGRVFDAAAFVLGLCGRNRHEAEAAMALEAAAREVDGVVEPLSYFVEWTNDGVALSLAPAIAELAELAGAADSPPRVAELAARFHEAAARLLAEAARLAADQQGDSCVALGGGCFANRILLSRVVSLLEQSRKEVLWPRRVPPGDGGISLGQAYVAARLANDP